MRRTVSALISIALTIACAGCSRPDEVKPVVDTSRSITLESPSGQYTLPLAAGSPGVEMNGSTSDGLEWSFKGGILRVKTRDGLECRFKEGILWVNDRAHGAVRPGDRLKLDRAGKVAVNGQERTPAKGP